MKILMIADATAGTGVEATKPALPSLAEIQSDAAAVKALVEKYAAVANLLPGVLGSALGGLRTALRGIDGHVTVEKQKAAEAEKATQAAQAAAATGTAGAPQETPTVVETPAK